MTDQPAERTDLERMINVNLDGDGLLWLINRAVFHPRGYALAVSISPTRETSFHLLGDGTAPWVPAENDDERGKLTLVEATLAYAATHNRVSKAAAA